MFRLVKRSSKTGLDQERVGAEPGKMREPSAELSECEKRQLRCPLGSDIRKFSAIVPAGDPSSQRRIDADLCAPKATLDAC